jgi:hypothetical protein
MKISVILLIFMVGCAGVTPQESLEGIDVSSKDQNCVRECTRTYSSCISNASISGGNRLEGKTFRIRLSVALAGSPHWP